jgi:diguanylate cyclase (GGDEF)-like protein
VQSMARKLRNSLKTWVCGLAAMGLAASACLCQQFSFSSITEGLGNLNVNCMAQDRSGYLWVGTENGLYRYDGRAFRQFSSADGLHGHIIESLFTAPDGTLFVGTTTGIYFARQDGQFSQIHSPAPVTEFSARIGTVFSALAPDQVATADRSGGFVLRRIAADSWVAEPMHLEGAAIWSVLAGPDGALWYGCDGDLCRRQNGITTHLRAALHLPEEQWLHLRLARDGHLWVRGVAHLVEVIPAENSFAEHDIPGRSNTATNSELVEDADGHIVASQGSALGIWENDHWRMVTALNGLSRYDISGLFVDREGSLWMGVVGHGLMRWVGQDRWEAYTAASGLSDDIVWSSLRDRSGRLWIGTESGLDYILAGETTPKVWQAPGIQTVRAVSLALGADGSVWMGSAAGGLVRIDPATMTGSQWKIPGVFRVLSDGGHRVWIATNAGLYLVDTTGVDRFPRLVEDGGIAHPRQRFTDLNLDKAKALWAAADDGLYRMDESGWHHIDPGLANVNPYVIAADATGNLWAAGAFPGLVRLRIVGDRIVESEHIVRRNLLSDRVVSLAVDHRGWVWVGQDAGLTVYDGHAWRSFTQDDGLIWNDTESEALAEDTDGSMWIGTSGGLSHLLRPQPVPVLSPPAPVFSQIMFGAVPISNQTEVRWSASPLSITVSAPSYRDASHIRIRYRLMGADSGWMDTAERIVRYNHLEPGPYRFQAVVVDESGGTISTVGGDSAAEVVSPLTDISFVITPRWWQSGPVRLALMLAIALGVVLAWRWSVHRLVEQKRQLEMAVLHRTEDLEKEKAELLRAREQMRHFAEHDDLTGMWNHRIILERLRQEVDRSRRERSPLSVILVDLDHFKNVNDTFGHQAGDLVLKEIGAILQGAVRSYDWVGRYGGEEFLLILPGSGFAGARLRAEQLRMAVQWAHIHDGQRAIPISASFGVASGFPSHFEALLRASDAALYRAKEKGRNCVIATEIQSGEGAEAAENHAG